MNLPKRHPGRRHRPACPDCAPDAGQEPDHLAYMNWVAGQVGEQGWAVPGAVGGDGMPPWAYSVGIWLTCQFAELIVCGAPLENMTGIVNAIGSRIAEGAQLGPGDVLTDICPARLVLRPVDMSWRRTGLFEVSDEFYGFVRPPYLQVVWADREGRFPWQPRFHPGYLRAQPFLWLPKDDNPPSPWTRIEKLRRQRQYVFRGNEMYASAMDVPVTELRAHLSDWLERAQGGEEIIVTDRGVPVVRILGVTATATIQRLTAEGVIGRPASAKRPIATGRDLPRARRPLSDIVSEQREERGFL